MSDEPMNDGPDASVAEPETSELVELQRERDDYKDRWLRKGADGVNIESTANSVYPRYLRQPGR